jgi:hypothetical protein
MPPSDPDEMCECCGEEAGVIYDAEQYLLLCAECAEILLSQPSRAFGVFSA